MLVPFMEMQGEADGETGFRHRKFWFGLDQFAQLHIEAETFIYTDTQSAHMYNAKQRSPTLLAPGTGFMEGNFFSG